MANSILSSLLSKTSFKATNELTGYPCWTNLQIIDVNFDGGAGSSDFPMSQLQEIDGATSQGLQVADIQALKVLTPTKVTIHGICPDISTVESILATFVNVQSTLTISSKGVVSATLSITSVEVDQSPDVLSASKVIIVLERTLPPQPSTSYAPAQAADAPSIGSRLQTLAGGLTTTVGNLYNSVSSYASSAASSISNLIP
jgi:hypothetical protein